MVLDTSPNVPPSSCTYDMMGGQPAATDWPHAQRLTWRSTTYFELTVVDGWLAA